MSSASTVLKRYTHATSSASSPTRKHVCLPPSLQIRRPPSPPDNECRSAPSYVFSRAGRLMSAHGPLIINLTLYAGPLIILTYLCESDLTSSPGLCFLSLSPSWLSLRRACCLELAAGAAREESPAPKWQTLANDAVLTQRDCCAQSLSGNEQVRLSFA